MAKKRFETLTVAEQLSSAVEKVVQLVPQETGGDAVQDLRRVSSNAVDLLLDQSEAEFQSTLRTVKSQSKVKAQAVSAE